jgi:hypothetical protein
MYTDPVIIHTTNLLTRAYVKVYIDGVRHRFYNGNDLRISCHPNRCVSTTDRDRALKTLSFTLKKKLDVGWRPGNTRTIQTTPGIITLNETVNQIPTNGNSKVYQRDQIQVCKSFITFLEVTKLEGIALESITAPHIETFLTQFKGSSTYYMNKRRTLSSVFSQYLALGLIPKNPVQFTRRKKETSTLNRLTPRSS